MKYVFLLASLQMFQKVEVQKLFIIFYNSSICQDVYILITPQFVKRNNIISV